MYMNNYRSESSVTVQSYMYAGVDVRELALQPAPAAEATAHVRQQRHFTEAWDPHSAAAHVSASHESPPRDVLHASIQEAPEQEQGDAEMQLGLDHPHESSQGCSDTEASVDIVSEGTSSADEHDDSSDIASESAWSTE